MFAHVFCDPLSTRYWMVFIFWCSPDFLLFSSLGHFVFKATLTVRAYNNKTHSLTHRKRLAEHV